MQSLKSTVELARETTPDQRPLFGPLTLSLVKQHIGTAVVVFLGHSLGDGLVIVVKPLLSEGVLGVGGVVTRTHA